MREKIQKWVQQNTDAFLGLRSLLVEPLEEMGNNEFIREVDRWTDRQHHKVTEESLDPNTREKEYRNREK